MFALLAGTLRTHQVSACDNEELHLECDSRTVVSIVVANYGQPVPQRHLCYKHSSSSLLGQQSDQSTIITNDASSNRCSEAKHLW
ncbi:Galactose binding lectin-like protein, partial [Euroglyphus maynei]